MTRRKKLIGALLGYAVVLTYTLLAISSRSIFIEGFKIQPVIAVAFFVMGLTLFTTSILNFKYGVVTATVALLLLTIVDSIKYSIRYSYLIFSDLKLTDEILLMNPFRYLFDYTRIIIIGVITLAIVIYLIKRYLKVKIDWDIRKVLLVISIVVMMFTYRYIIYTNYSYSESGAVYTFLRTTFTTTNNFKLTKKESAELNDFDLTHYAMRETADKPNIIMIMSESFWDINKLPSVTYSRDPLEYFNSLKDESIYGELEVSVFSGGTALTEYEAVSGFSTHMYETGHMVYTNEINEPTVSIASVLRKQGYLAYGLHSYEYWFYDRDEVYKRLGFNQFSANEHMNFAEKSGTYISDQSTFDEINKYIADNDDPMFVLAVTMQNHGPYNDNRYESFDISLDHGGTLDEDQEMDLLTFTQGMYESDIAMKNFIEGLRESEEETYVVFFGDHLPLYGGYYNIYKETGFTSASEKGLAGDQKKKTTPFFIWSNTGKVEPMDMGIIDASFLTPILLEQAGLCMPDYMHYVLDLSKDVRYINSEYYVDIDGTAHYRNSAAYKELNSRYSLLFKDLIYNDSILENLSRWKMMCNEDFNADVENIYIERVEVSGDTVIIEGENLYRNATLKINGDKYDFTFEDGRIIVTGAQLEETNDIVMKLYDMKRHVIAESSRFSFKK